MYGAYRYECAKISKLNLIIKIIPAIAVENTFNATLIIFLHLK